MWRFLPKWVGYAWAFPRIDHVSFGIATTQDAFDHEKLDALLWDFMVSYYEVAQVATPVHGCGFGTKQRSETQIKNLRQTAERYAARIPGPRAAHLGHAQSLRRRMGFVGRCRRLCGSRDG